MSNSTNIVILDGYTLNPGDLNWGDFDALGAITIYDRTPEDQVLERAKEAEILIVNKVMITVGMLEQLPQLKCICVTATGYNNIDIDATRQKNIPVCNVKGYSSESVAQHVFAMMLDFTNQVAAHHQSVNNGGWSRCPDFSYTLNPVSELSGKTMGIYGFGRIGQAVAKIALAFGMKVIAKHKHPERDKMQGVTFVDTENLFRESDFLSLHAPLTEENAGLIRKTTLQLMKPSAILINTARGGFVVENDLKEALKNGTIAGAALDVLSTEPPAGNHILIGVKNCLLTPHLAWASREARQRLMAETVHNVESFLKGEFSNVVNF
ncbi:MAG: D-2-hydroxyacid dehydrogenase [Lewinellaceae bacterium]|nr:D-2-hydroxyacid dehydrogenase [Lewinellaceae bacterium]